MAMDSPSTSTAAAAVMAAAASNADVSHLGGIEALRLKVGPVRRNLFGPVDHQQLQQDFQRLLCMSVEVANKRWNFDFNSDVPGRGRGGVEWEELRCQDVPSFYRSCTVRPLVRLGAGAGAAAKKKGGARRASLASSASSSGEGSPSSSGSSASGDEYYEVTTRGCYRLQRGEKRKQSAITDFFKVKKRRLLHYKASSRQ